ncbi:MAG: YibE/F family protein [Clostridia bacterium]|nr:YibE/F family protein [Clostridia bacterium]
MNKREKLIQTFKAYGRKNRLFLCLFALLLIFCIGVIIFASHNYGFYDSYIAKVKTLDEKEDHTEYSMMGEKSERFYLQIIEAELLNGERCGERIILENIRSESNVYDTRYREGDKLFVSENDGEWAIDGVKRDVWVIAAILIFLSALICVGKSKGVFSFISLVINVALLWIGLKAYIGGVGILSVSVICTLLFCLISLVFIGGFSRMTLISLISTLLGTAASFLLSLAVIYGFKFSGLYVEGLEFLIITIDYRVTFLSQILLGGLGAIMDVSVSVSSAMCELKRRDPLIERKALLRSAKEVGRDITGTMTNVLLFTYLCGSLPLLVVVVSNGVPLINYIFANCNLEITRFLCGSIGIVLSVPISCICSALLLTGFGGKGKKV